MNVRQRLARWIAPETRDAPVSVETLTSDSAGAPLHRAESVSAVLAAINLISSTIAALPVYVYRKEGGQRIEQPDHELAQLARRGPNPAQTWPDFVEWMLGQTLLHGNAIAEIVRDDRAALVELRPIPWPWTTPVMLSSGELAYDVSVPAGLHGATGRRRRLLAGQVLRLSDRSDDGLIGRARLDRSGDVLRSALAVSDFARSYFGNSTRLSGVLKHPGRFSAEAVGRIRDTWAQAYGGLSKVGKVAILEEGMSFEAIQANPEDSELLQSRRFIIEEVARIFQVQPPLIQDFTHGTFTNSREAARWFSQFSLTPWIRKLEEAVKRSLLAPGSPFEFEIDMSGLLRGDAESRWASHKIAVEANILDPNEIREVEGWNPRTQAAGAQGPAGAQLQ